MYSSPSSGRRLTSYINVNDKIKENAKKYKVDLERLKLDLIIEEIEYKLSPSSGRRPYYVHIYIYIHTHVYIYVYIYIYTYI